LEHGNFTKKTHEKSEHTNIVVVHRVHGLE
jgi:hypothetical protein